MQGSKEDGRPASPMYYSTAQDSPTERISPRSQWGPPPQTPQQHEVEKLLEMGEQRQRAQFEKEVRTLREKLEAAESMLERARDEASEAQEHRRSADRVVADLKQKLQASRLDAEHAQTLLRQEITQVSAETTAERRQAERLRTDLEAALASSRGDVESLQVECAQRRAEVEEIRAEMHAQKETHWTASQALERKGQMQLAEQKEKFAKSKQELLATNDKSREDIAQAYKDESVAYVRQNEALMVRVQEAESVVVTKDREIAELMEAIEELEMEKRSEVQHIETQRQVERRRLQQQQKEKIGQVENRYQREQHALRSFVFTTAKSMLSHINMEKALKKVDLYSSDSDSE